MAQIDRLKFVMHYKFQCLSTLIIGKMTMPLDYPFFQLWGVGTPQEHIRIEIRLDNDIIGLKAILNCIIWDLPQICHKYKFITKKIYKITYRIGSIMRNSESHKFHPSMLIKSLLFYNSSTPPDKSSRTRMTLE